MGLIDKISRIGVVVALSADVRADTRLENRLVFVIVAGRVGGNPQRDFFDEFSGAGDDPKLDNLRFHGTIYFRKWMVSRKENPDFPSEILKGHFVNRHDFRGFLGGLVPDGLQLFPERLQKNLKGHGAENGVHSLEKLEDGPADALQMKPSLNRLEKVSMKQAGGVKFDLI